MKKQQTKTSYEQFKDDQKKTAWGCLTLLAVLVALIFPVFWIPIIIVAFGLFLQKRKQ